VLKFKGEPISKRGEGGRQLGMGGWLSCGREIHLFQCLYIMPIGLPGHHHDNASKGCNF